jgi:hypothetical protein
MSVHDPNLPASQNAFIAPSNIVGADLGVHSNTVSRKGDSISVYAFTAIVSPAVYQRDYVDKQLKECDYSFKIGKNKIAIGLTEPQIGQGIGSFLNSSYNHPVFKNNTKFVVKGKLLYTVLKIEGLPARNEFFAPYGRRL